MTEQVEAVPDYGAMSDAEMLQALEADAQKWATAFCQKFPAVPYDEAFGRFANAMMAMWDWTNSEITHHDEMLVDHISNLVRNRDMVRRLAELDAAKQKADSQ